MPWNETWGPMPQPSPMVALACTEIPLLVSPGVSPLPTLDFTRLLAGAAFAVCAGRRPMPDWRGGPVGS